MSRDLQSSEKGTPKASRRKPPAAEGRAEGGAPRAGAVDRLRRRLRDLWRGSLGFRALWAVVFIVLGSQCLLPRGFFVAPRATEGAIAAQDYVAPRELLVPDEASTRAKQDRVREAVLPIYDLDAGLQVERDQELENLFAEGRQWTARLQEAHDKNAAGESTLAAFGTWKLAVIGTPDPEGRAKVPSGLKLTSEDFDLLARKNFSSDLEDQVRSAVARALRRGIVANKALLLENRLRGITVRNLASGVEREQLDLFNYLGYPDELRDFLETEVRSARLTVPERHLLAELIFTNLEPNLHVNRGATLAAGEAAAAAVGPVGTQVHQGQVIVRKGDKINATAARLIGLLAGDRRLSHQVPPVAGTVFLLSLAALVVWWSAPRRSRALGHSQARVANKAEASPRRAEDRAYGKALLLLLLALLASKFFLVVAAALSASLTTPPFHGFQSWVYTVPFAALSLLAALLLGRPTALVLAFLFPLLISRAVDGDALWVVLYATAGSLAAIFALDAYPLKQRLVLMRIGGVVGLVQTAMVLILASFAGGDRGLVEIGFDVLCALASGFLVAAVASSALPVLESLLAVTTDIKLIELSNANLPLLRRLAFEAPGTFQHSLMVANLAKEGCEAIGADAVLAYAGGLYHDVGKIYRPEYFIENQRPGNNRHDKLQPSMSAFILTQHVKQGVELASEHDVPRPILDAIEQHHGTRLIKFFYNRAREQADPAGAEVTEESYRYPGPQPQNRVMGVLMLADVVEAASRTLVEPTPAKIRTLVKSLTEDCLRDGQLDATDLTLQDLTRVTDSFLRVLANIFHQRIDYPGLDWNAEPSRVSSRELPSAAVTPE